MPCVVMAVWGGCVFSLRLDALAVFFAAFEQAFEAKAHTLCLAGFWCVLIVTLR